MKRKDFIRSLLGLAAAPTVLKNIEAKGFQPKAEKIAKDFNIATFKHTPFDKVRLHEEGESFVTVERPIEKVLRIYIDGQEIKCETTPYASVGKTFTAKGNKITFKS